MSDEPPIETENAIYLIGFESHHRHDDTVLKNPVVDAFSFERGEIDYRASNVQERMEAAKGYLGERRPPVFIVDIPATEEQLRSLSRRVANAYALRATAAVVLGREIYGLIKAQRAKKKSMQPPAEKKKSRVREKLSMLAAKLKNTSAGRKLAQYYASVLSREKQMNPARRKLLKTGVVLGALVAAEGVSPDILREVPQTREFAETIDIAHRDVVRALRNAVIAERLDSIVAPKLRQELLTRGEDRKPVIAVVLGRSHIGFEVYLRKPQFRQKALQKFSKEIQEIRYRRDEFIDTFRYDPLKRGYVPKQMQVPRLSKENKPGPQARMSRRGFFRYAARKSMDFAARRVSGRIRRML